MIGAAEAHQVRTPRVIAGEPDGLHDRFGARHMEGDFVEPGDQFQPAHVVGDDGMIGAKDRTEIANAFIALDDTFFVEIVAEYIDPRKTPRGRRNGFRRGPSP